MPLGQVLTLLIRTYPEQLQCVKAWQEEPKAPERLIIWVSKKLAWWGLSDL